MCYIVLYILALAFLCISLSISIPPETKHFAALCLPGSDTKHRFHPAAEAQTDQASDLRGLGSLDAGHSGGFKQHASLGQIWNICLCVIFIYIHLICKYTICYIYLCILIYIYVYVYITYYIYIHSYIFCIHYIIMHTVLIYIYIMYTVYTYIPYL